LEAANFWLFVLSVSVLCLIVDWAFKGFKRNLYPEPFHVIQNIRLASSAEFSASAEHSRVGLTAGDNPGMPLTPKGTFAPN
jgi:hypothetical protein